MSDLSLLKNTGVLTLNKPQSHSTEKTVVVLGVARGGTTMVASVLETLGVYMGDKLGPVKEDVTLSAAVERGDIEQIEKIVAQRNAAHPIWGWKRPSAIEHNGIWKGKFRNPYIIAVFRDPFAIANRNRISMLSDVFQNMSRAVQYLDSLVRFLQEQHCPVLLCSYEKVLASPEDFVQAVDEFLGLNVSERWNDAVLQINPASKEYLESSRITNSLGSLDVANTRFCSGWAFYPKQPKRQGKVQILVNDKLVHAAIAKLPRADLKDGGIHPTGLCGFKFEWPAGIKIAEGDRISAQLEGDTQPLKGSPREAKAGRDVSLPRSAASAGSTGALPSFYGIGAQAAGTAWLHEMLKAHPKIHLPTCKEVHYWDVHSERPLRWYRNHFVPEQINGDITPAYGVLPEAKVVEIHQLTPQAKLLLSMRHPIDRAWSFVEMEVARKFGQCPHDLMAGNPQGEILDFVRRKLFKPNFLMQSDYATSIRRWRKHFGDDALMYYRYERIAQDPRGLLVDICRHIGADPAWADGLKTDALGQMLSTSEKIPFPPALRAEYVELCAPYIDDLEQLLGQRFDDWRA
ncbi:MAG: sulfotransferase domain-containing protein [Gammaproteobacteria bacterium]|nr:sulfotransferase domain-containing protein [Gammaproteobacteria bacterium]MBU1623995.1 sulfotransferase domain-containing protein [Gammaproteobacteria bacterium]MBU1981723.1 sulfotransferase domain-containing protein [Gammaproteobacteria bacterium]